MDLRTGLKQVRTTILEPVQQQSGMSPAEQQAAASMLAFHKDSRAAFVELEVRAFSAVAAEMTKCDGREMRRVYLHELIVILSFPANEVFAGSAYQRNMLELSQRHNM